MNNMKCKHIFSQLFRFEIEMHSGYSIIFVVVAVRVNIPGVNFVSVASAKTDGVGSHVNLDVPGCVFGD